jgi:hypothetical protein
MVNQSITVKITSKPCESGRTAMKSIEIDYYSLLGVGNGCSNP